MRKTERDPIRLPHSVRWGIGLAATTALISGVAVWVNSFAVSQMGDATIFTTLKNGVAAVLLTTLVLATPTARHGIAALSRRQWLGLVAIGIIGGGVPFLLFFNGLAMASAPSAAFIHKTLFIWVALLAVPLLGERIGLAQLAALGVLGASQLLIAPPTGVTWGSGETLIALATGMWTVEVIVARRLLRSVPSPIVGAGRMVIGMVVLVGFVIVTGRAGAMVTLTGTQWLLVVGTGLLLTGYVASWYAALRRAPASVVTAVLVAAAPITAFLTAIGKGGTSYSPTLLAGYGLLLCGVLVMGWIALRSRPRPAAAG